MVKPVPQDPNAAKELDKVEKQFESFNDNLQTLTMDRLNQAPKSEQEPQTKMSSNEIAKSQDIYLKPIKTIASGQKFNERWREEYNFAKEYVQFIAENKEVIGENIDLWTRPFPGMPAEEWKVPVNKPVWGPRYLAEQIKRCYYHRLVMGAPRVIGIDGAAQYYDTVAVDTTVQRLDAQPVSSRKSIFMGAVGF